MFTLEIFPPTVRAQSSLGSQSKGIPKFLIIMHSKKSFLVKYFDVLIDYILIHIVFYIDLF